MNKEWKVKEKDEEKISEMVKEYNISPILADCLIKRNIVQENDIRKFLSPTRNDFYNSFLMPDMEKAVNRILTAIKNNEKTIIYGDYDVDGITSITVLKNFLKDRNFNVDYYIPNRLEEGYGLNNNAIKKIADNGYTLMITVDCGITAIEEVNYAKSLGIDTIVTDHHEPIEELPNAIGVVDAKRKDSIYPFRELAGVGVTFKFIQAISKKMYLKEEEYLKYLDIVCIGTISDIVPLVDENRVIAKLGLMLVKQTKNIGLKTLIASIGYKEINSTAVSFGIAPRINASGRMGEAEEALKLFLTSDSKEAQNITHKLNQYNQERQETEKKIFDEAREIIEKEEEKNFIIVGKEGWHHGVIGIVASKVTEMYFKPSILVCFEGEEAKGSGRSIPGFDLHEALVNCSTYLEKFGGHSMAIGLSFKKKNFEKIKKQLQDYVQEVDISGIIPIIELESEVSLKGISIEDVKSIYKLEPFGEANKMPIFLFKNLKIDSIRSLSEGKHLKLTLKSDKYIINAIGFNIGKLVNEYVIGDKVEIAGVLEINEFNGMENIQINIKDIRKALQ